VLPCKDGYVEIITTQDRHWHVFVDVLGNPEWASDPRYQNRVKMSKYGDEIDALLAPWLMSHTKQEIFEICRERHLPFQPVRNMDEVLDSEQLRVREFFVEVDVPGSGKVKVPGAPYKLTETPWELTLPAPRLGEHNVQIFCKRLCCSKQDLVKMAQAGVV
ncbi:MAG: CoA transferase, partial [Dehalococcoidia bacterium]|nr:CoA transferase [Dehalococcoidia bacterium]